MEGWKSTKEKWAVKIESDSKHNDDNNCFFHNIRRFIMYKYTTPTISVMHSLQILNVGLHTSLSLPTKLTT